MTRPSLRDQSSARPSAEIDWERHAARAQRQQQSNAEEVSNYRGDDYLQRVAEEDPWPVVTEEDSRGAQILSVHITTPPQKLKSHHPADVNVKVRVLREEYRKKIDLHLQSKPAAQDNATWARTSHGAVYLATDLAAGTETELSTPLRLVGQRVDVGDLQEYRAVATHPESSEEFISETVQAVFTLPVRVVEVPDMLFNHGGRLPCLDANDYLVGALATALLYARDEASQAYSNERGIKHAEELVVFGHTDTSDSDEVNYAVSEQRAQAVKSLLDQDVEAWKAIAKAHTKVDDYQTMLKVLTERYGWNCDPGSVDGKDGPKTKGAVKAFQQQANARYQLGLTEDGIIGPKTWGAVHRVLCGLVAKAMGAEDPTAPAYPGWQVLAYGYEAGKGCYGCGESFPIESKELPNYRSQTNRRVELLFLPKGGFKLQPPPDRNRALRFEECLVYDPRCVRRYNLLAALSSNDFTLQSEFACQHFKGLAGKLSTADFYLWCFTIFGADLEKQHFHDLRADLLSDQFFDPQIVVSDDGLDGHLAGYQQPPESGRIDQARIQVSVGLVRQALISQEHAWTLLAALVEEFGHHVDWALRNHYSRVGGDAPLDEGAAFAHALIPFEFHKQAFVQFATAKQGQDTQQLEVRWDKFKEILDLYFSQAAIHSDEKTELMEFFSPGDGHGTCSHGHRSIENAVQRELRCDDYQMRQMYFGNWTRDFSQIIDPKLLFPAIRIDQPFWTQVVDFLGYREFRWNEAEGREFPESQMLSNNGGGPFRHDDFRVTVNRLGLYRPEEHMDNPCGIESYSGGGVTGPVRFRSACPESSAELRTDPATWMRSYLSVYQVGRTQASSNSLSVPEYFAEQIRMAVQSGKGADGLRHLGNALHCLEDFYAHSNFIELALRMNGVNTVPWVQKEPGQEYYPVTTGCFGPLDTAASISYALIEALEKNFREAGSDDDGYEQYLLLATFLTDNLDLKWDAELKASIKLLYCLTHDKRLREGETASWPPEFRVAGEVVDKIVEYRGYVDFLKVHERILKLVQQMVARSMGMLKLQLLRPVKGIANRVGEFQAQQNRLYPVGYPRIPTHSQLAKDHDDHPLHNVAALCAQVVAREIGVAVNNRWDNQPGALSVDQIIERGRAFLFHPDRVNALAGTPHHDVRGMVMDVIRSWRNSREGREKIPQCQSIAFITSRERRCYTVLDQLQSTLTQAARDANTTVDELMNKLETFWNSL